MKGILFAVLMAVSLSAHSWTRGDVQLILTIISGRHTSVATGQFGKLDACEKAGKRWLEAANNTYAFDGRDAFYICERTH